MIKSFVSIFRRLRGVILALRAGASIPRSHTTPRDEFLDHLSKSSFGKVICINLFRSARIGTLRDSAVRDFLDKCIVAFAHMKTKTPSKSDWELARDASTDWPTRAALMSSSEFPCPPSGDVPVQFVTVIRCDKVERKASVARAVTYGGWKMTTQRDLEILVDEWAKGKGAWTFGEGLNYFWLARPLDTSACPSHRSAQGAAQLHRDTLGLCHFGKADRLVRALIPATLASGGAPLLRPTALDGVDNPAFLAACDSELSGPAQQPGTTRDLYFRTDPKSEYGVHEWLCKPMTLEAASVIWDYLGQPTEAACNSDTRFHDQILTRLQIQTPVHDALDYLRNVA